MIVKVYVYDVIKVGLFGFITIIFCCIGILFFQRKNYVCYLNFVRLKDNL